MPLFGPPSATRTWVTLRLPGIVVDVVEVVLVVVVGEHGVPAACAVRNGVKSTLAVTLSHPALPGPATQPHQLFSAAMSVAVEALVRSSTPKGVSLPAKLLLWIFVPVVCPGVPSSSMRMAPKGVTVQGGRLHGEKVGGDAPFMVKQLLCTMALVVPLRISTPARPAVVPVNLCSAPLPECLPADLGVAHERVAGDRGGGVVLVPKAADAGVVHEVVADRVAVVRVGTAAGEPDPEGELILRHVRVEAD